MCFCLILCFGPEVIQGLSLALFLDSLYKGKRFVISTTQFLIENKHNLIGILNPRVSGQIQVSQNM